MSQPTINWQNANLDQFIPGIVQTLVSSGFGSALSAFADVKKVNAAITAAKIALDSPGALDPTLVPLRALLTTVNNSIIDLLDTGYYFMLMPVAAGGIRGFQREWNNAILNSSDIHRPVFSPSAIVAAVGGFAFFLDNRLTELAAQSIQKAFVSNQTVARALGVEQFTTAGGQPVPHMQNILAATARPVKRAPWINVTIGDMIPGLSDLLLQIQAACASLLNTISPSSVKNYLDFATRQINALNTTVNQINQLISFLQTSFDPLPLHLFNVPPVQAGTTALSQAIGSDFFDPVKHPLIADASGTFFTTGFVIVMGSDSAAVTQTQYDTLKTIFPI